MGHTYVFSVDYPEILACGGTNVALIHKTRYRLKKLVLHLHVIGVVHRPGEHEFAV